jgi:hypothetical protein
VSFNENTFLDEFQIHQPQPAPPPAPAAAAAEGSTPLRMFNQRKPPSVTSLFLPPPYNKPVLECFITATTGSHGNSRDLRLGKDRRFLTK